MSPRTGRPTDNPKNIGYRIRMTDEENEMLNFACKVLGLTKADVIRRGIKTVYEEAQKKQ